MRFLATYSIHAGSNGEVLGGILLRGKEETDSLGSRDIDHLGLGLFSIDTINLDNAHGVILKPEVLSSKGTHVDHAEEVRSLGLDGESEVHSLVHQSGVRDRLSTRRVRLDHEELGDEILHLIVIPVRQCQNKLFINLLLVRKVLVVNNQRAAQTVGVLCAGVGVIPVSTRLVDLNMKLVLASCFLTSLVLQ
jgi:hypothetical protein